LIAFAAASGRARAARGLGAVALAACVAGCNTPWYFRIDELHPSSVGTIRPNAVGAHGTCFSMPDVPSFDVSAEAGQGIVGFHHFHDPGTSPLPCASFRVTLPRAHATFPLDKYDSILVAYLLFDTLRSIDRDATATYSQIPGVSYGTRVGAAVPHDNIPILDPIPVGWRMHPVTVNVTPLVNDWITNARPNAGFIVANSEDLRRMLYDEAPHDNNAQLSWYGNFRLQILYNVPDNPRTPPPPP
jgi:hypothetical protein